MSEINIKERIKERIKEKADTITFFIDVKDLSTLPLKTVMTSLSIVESNNRVQGMYFEYCPEVQHFIELHQAEYASLRAQENEQFKMWSEVYFSEMRGPLYQSANRVLNLIDRIYQKERHFDNIEPVATLPKIIWKTQQTSEGYELHVKNIDELNDTVGQAAMLHTLVLLKDCMNHDYQEKHDSQLTPYKLSTGLISQLYNSKLEEHEYLEKFSGNDYFLSQMNEMAMKKMKFNSQDSANTILRLVLINEAVRLSEEKEQNLHKKSKNKP